MTKQLPQSRKGQDSKSLSLGTESQYRHARNKARGGERRGIDALLVARELAREHSLRPFVPSGAIQGIMARKTEADSLAEARDRRRRGEILRAVEPKAEFDRDMEVERLMVAWDLKRQK